ncbi:hypothetical protein PRIPAC_90720 [Pristionchus pacificus]|uniref:Uncharacterized protein n=1 Tax=Pristionchus pacificus TaxID=54126 RepID=A0A2A6B3X0_PRIPA|nr:hypothetical protein PRIPAC_90720 [Pristionchus pacificus]|eukprot:PDM60585.1 hypothetical protein PRIPAC_53563 [Pristionchus pacificus]
MAVTRTLVTHRKVSAESIEKKNVEDMYLVPDLDEMEMMEEEVREARPPLKIVWRNVAIFSLLHLGALVGLHQFIFEAKWMTCFFALLLDVGSKMGITAGAHRMWAHKAFKAALPVRIYFMLWGTVAFQNDVIEWARDHRCHHKWTDTEADPHNSRRGFWYSHVGWLCARKSEKLKEMGRKIDLSDLYADPVLTFQRKHYYPLVLLMCFILPTFIPVYFWGETAFNAFYVAAILRYAFTLNCTWLINSAAHMFGYKPYDATISPVESAWANIQAVGEGGHNFHHSFPQDYRASELSLMTNWTRAVIDFFALFGLVYDRKTASEASIKSLSQRKGDSSGHWHH